MRNPLIPKIKICGIKDLTNAKLVVTCDIDFVGLVFHKTSIRYVELEEAIKIAKLVTKAGKIPVAVFTNHTAEQMLNICQRTTITCVQLHGDTARSEHHKLPQHFTRIYALGVNTKGEIVNANTQNLKALQPTDYLLYDGVNPGSGNTINTSTIQPYKNMRFFIAGGVRKNNVLDIVAACKPYAVDVSSGVEKEKGIKDINLMKDFVTALNGSYKIYDK